MRLILNLQQVAVAALGSVAMVLSAGASAEEKPLWEVGMGVGTVSFPEYRGSDKQRAWVVPTPYLVYRGKFLQSDRNGVRGTLFNSERVQLNLSVSASLPVESDSHGARWGMPDLQPTVEFGPSLDIALWRSAGQRARLDMRLPVRTAYTIRGGVGPAGVVFMPSLNLNFNTRLFGQPGWNVGALAGPIFANTRQHTYFYEVSPRYALPDRPAYRASGGYSGSQFVASLSRRFDSFWVGSFVRYDALRGAAFDDSPLVKRKSAWIGGLGVAWLFGKSSRTVQADG